MDIRIADIANEKYVGGAIHGASALAHLVNAVGSCSDVDVVYLDFAGIEIATASYLREAVIGFRDYCRSHRQHLYPVVANANDIVLGELDLLLRDRRDAIVACKKLRNSVPREARVIGRLDEKQALTLRFALDMREVDAPSLAAGNFDGASIGVTGWNNRLAALASKGLLIETIRGRCKYYRPVMEEMRYGG